MTDILVAWYTVSYTTDDKAAEVETTSYHILEVQQSISHTVLIRSDDGVRLSSSGFSKYNLGANATGACIGDMTDAVAITTQDSAVWYYQPGKMTPLFSVDINGSASLIGITERYATTKYVPDQLVLVVSNTTNTSLVVLSISAGGSVHWTRDLGSGVVATARTEGTDYFATALDNNSVLLFRWTSSTPTMVYLMKEPVREIALSETGDHLAVLSGHDPTRLSVFETDSIKPVLDIDLPGNCTDLKLQKEIESIFVKSGNNILKISNDQVGIVVSRDDLKSYATSTVVEGLFVSTKQGVFAYKGGRNSPIWEARVGDICRNVITDSGGAVVIGFDSDHLVTIDNTDVVLGSKTGWFAVGLAVIGESIALIGAFSWRRIRSPKKGTIYVLVAGAFVGIAVSAAFLNESSAGLFGGTLTYLLFVGIIGAISTLLAWNSAAGISAVALGLFVGLVMSVPIALVFQFGLWYSGYVFSTTDPVFKSIINGLYDGIRTGLVGGIAGYVIQRLYL
jgi:hypothetical protein